MKRFFKYLRYPVAASVFAGAAVLVSCSEKGNRQTDPINEETLVSRRIDSMTVISSENGVNKHRLWSPRMDTYEFAREPFSEYPRGMEVITYNDTTGLESSRIVADYALHWTNRDLWELKGNVKVSSEEENRKLFSQQLFWDRKIKKIYSNVDSKVEDDDVVFIGEGFDADDDFKSWTFRMLKGQANVDINSTEPSTDTTATDASSPAAEGIPAVPPKDSDSSEMFIEKPGRRQRPRIRLEDFPEEPQRMRSEDAPKERQLRRADIQEHEAISDSQ